MVRVFLRVDFAPRTLVDRELGREDVRPGLHEPAHAVEVARAGSLFAAGERKLDAAARTVAVCPW